MFEESEEISARKAENQYWIPLIFGPSGMIL